MLRRDGRDYVCPVDLSLRSWLSLTSLVDNIGDAAASLIFPPNALSSAGDQFLRWRRDNPDAVPHIRTSTWGIPRTWFVLVVEDERELYDHEGATSVRYRARVSEARTRVGAAQRLLRSVIDDGELLDELADLESWLEAFHLREPGRARLCRCREVVARATIYRRFGRRHPSSTRCSTPI